jgi:hypothetical protein
MIGEWRKLHSKDVVGTIKEDELGRVFDTIEEDRK